MRCFNAMVTMMSSLLFHSLPPVRLFFPFSPALSVVVIKSGHPEFLSPRHRCRHVYFQQNAFSPFLPLLPDLYLVPLMFQVALHCAPYAIQAFLSPTSPHSLLFTAPLGPSLPLLQLSPTQLAT